MKQLQSEQRNIVLELGTAELTEGTCELLRSEMPQITTFRLWKQSGRTRLTCTNL